MGFLSKAFESSEIRVGDEAMDMMKRYSSGLPALMQEIGDATYWENSDSVIDTVETGLDRLHSRPKEDDSGKVKVEVE